MVKHFNQLVKKLYGNKNLPVQTQALVEYDALVYFPGIGRAYWESELIFTGTVLGDGVHQYEAPGGWLVYNDPAYYEIIDVIELSSASLAVQVAA